VAFFVTIKKTHDLLRTAGVDWLLTEFTVLAGEANRAGASIQISKQEGHRFPTGTSTMVGHLLTLTNGVRTLYVEAGWPRAPRDGVVRGGGLAAANIRHLGIKAANEELLLARSNTGAPAWKSVSNKHASVLQADLRRHIAILLDKNR
jgi:hypothetical protein